MKTPGWREDHFLESEKWIKPTAGPRSYQYHWDGASPSCQWGILLRKYFSLAGWLLCPCERGSGMWKIPLFYLNRILNFNSESITRIIVCCMKFRKIEKSPNLWCSRQSSDHRLGWGWKPGIICLLGRDVLLVSVARAAPLATLSTLRLPFPQQKSFNSKEVLSYTKFFI